MIEILAYLSLAFVCMQLVIAFTNWVFAPAQENPQTITGLLSVLIPARNEELNISALLSDLQRQNIDEIEILVYDDQSTDRTAEIVQQYADTDKRIRLISSQGLPAGWLGKNFACHTLSEHAQGAYLLFIDADVRLDQDAARIAISSLSRGGYGLLSVFPRQIMLTIGEKLTVPIMNYILLSLLPLLLVRTSRFSSLAAANGQFMLFRSETYFALHPHQQVRNCRAEDIAIARLFKRNGSKVACLASWGSIRCRMYQNGNEAVSGFSKNIAYFFGGSNLAALAFWALACFGFLPVLLTWNIAGLAIYTVIWLAVHYLCSATSMQNHPFRDLYLAFPQKLFMFWIVYKSITNRLKKEQLWKGRNVYL